MSEKYVISLIMHCHNMSAFKFCILMKYCTQHTSYINSLRCLLFGNITLLKRKYAVGPSEASRRKILTELGIISVKILPNSLTFRKGFSLYVYKDLNNNQQTHHDQIQQLDLVFFDQNLHLQSGILLNLSFNFSCLSNPLGFFRANFGNNRYKLGLKIDLQWMKIEYKHFVDVECSLSIYKNCLVNNHQSFKINNFKKCETIDENKMDQCNGNNFRALVKTIKKQISLAEYALQKISHNKEMEEPVLPKCRPHIVI
ncbi:hypothetical protein AGLY_007296 [Aphis glycines]|uniref:Uncharacterized protein n=1 Tax=Aphis glycines TaxID=307491 RepID=A0A6G0TQE5_APHGL|nr:hypothetical protein AGLY_007296 [Aphis glycines]